MDRKMLEYGIKQERWFTVKYVISFIIAFLIVYTQGCENPTNNSDTGGNKNNQIEIDEETPNPSVSLEEKFIPPDFLIDDFIINYKDNNQTLNLEISYVVSDKLNKILNQNIDYYFQIQLPKRVEAFFDSNRTEMIKGEKNEHNRLDYKIKMEVKLNKPLQSKQIEEMEEDKTGYELFILDQDKDPIHYFDDIELFSTVNPINSQHKMIKEEQNK